MRSRGRIGRGIVGTVTGICFAENEIRFEGGGRVKTLPYNGRICLFNE